MDERPPASPGVRLRMVPKEHGASFMSAHALLLGIVAGFVGGGRSVTGLLLALVVGALFLPFTAAVSALTHRKLAPAARRRTLEIGAALAIAGALALWMGPARELLGVAVTGGVLGALYLIARIRTGPRSMVTELTAIAGISLLAPLAWLLIAGPSTRWQLAPVAAFLSFGGTVPYVRERVRRRRLREPALARRMREGALALAWQAATLLVAAAGVSAGRIHPLVLASFVPGAVKTLGGIARPETAPPMRRLGYVETAVSTAFAVMAGIGLAMAS
ncbi:MAG TPA: YwiC-like family protein [Actinomycetota bacterium]